MGHDDLERQLRTERGPRETGYAPADLPVTIEGRLRPNRGMTFMRGGLFAAAAGAAVLAVLVVSGGLNGRGGFGGPPTPTPGDVKSQAPTPSVSAAPEIGSCTPDGIVMTAEPWGGAAGSRGTMVTLSLAPGAAACHPSVSVLGRMVDANGASLVESATGPVDLPLLTLEAGTSFQVGVAWSNWCDPAPSAPVSLQLRLADWSSWMSVEVPAGADPVPPCNGDGASNLSVTNLQAAP